VNTSDPLPGSFRAGRRVLEIQTKLHRWANDDPHRRFDDLFNLVTDPGFLMMAWERVAGNKGARSAGVDGQTVAFVRDRSGVENFLAELRDQLKTRSFRPLPVRERMIPKPGSRKRRRLGIPTVADRVVQASLKLVLEPIFEADFVPCSYGFRSNRRAHDAIAETLFLASKTYEWVLEGDIAACFDEISHSALMDRVRARIADKRVLALVKAFLGAGILAEGRAVKDTDTGTPQGSLCAAAHNPPCGLPVTGRRTPRPPHDVPAVDLVIQRVESSSGIGLGRPVKRMLQSTDRAGTPDARGGTSHEGTHRPLLDQPTRERSSGPSHHRRLCCPSGSIGTTTASDAVPAGRPLPGSSPVIRRRSPVRFRRHRAGDGLPSSRHHLLNVPRPLRRGVPRGCAPGSAPLPWPSP
jgi:retron-type reverse transcriptase